tara:strand:+ start:605 stop:838 length:234 start_codon:yes stop_codon:yes gene_type:complete
MKQLILTLSLILGLANSAFALDAGDRHADPFKVMTKGQVIGQDSYGINGDIDTYFIVAYKTRFTDVIYGITTTLVIC